MYLVKDETLDSVMKFLGNLAKPATEMRTTGKTAILKEDAKELQTLLLKAEAVQVKAESDIDAPEPRPPAAQPTHCQWKDCYQPGGRCTTRGIRLCTFHYSQALGTGRVEVVA